jgi:hypothetical protein
MMNFQQRRQHFDLVKYKLMEYLEQEEKNYFIAVIN